MIESTDRLMHELHEAILAPSRDQFKAALLERQNGDESANPLASGAALREAMFYGGESAFSWHYLNFARERYKHDSDWLQQAVGFTIEQAVALSELIIDHLASLLPDKMAALRSGPPELLTMLPMFTFTKADLVVKSNLDENIVQRFLDAYSVPNPANNADFVDTFSPNVARIYPFINLGDDQYTSLLEYTTCEALYDNPFYWMIKDPSYRGSASQNRGRFAEHIVFGALENVFPETAVYRNVTFKDKKGSARAEADAIVVFGHRALVFQVKSKKLTESSKRGDDLSISKDFKSAVQDAYDQSVRCIEAVRLGTPAFQGSKPLHIAQIDQVRTFYPVCISSEHYPSLAYQVEQFLQYTESDRIAKPLVFDLFTLDIIAEFLKSPLYFMDYLSKRSFCQNRISSSHEMVIFSYHLRCNLHLPSEYSFMYIQDDFLVDLDLAVNVRRRGLPGADTPPGILTRDLDTPLGRVLREIEKSRDANIHQVGELILSLSGKSYRMLDQMLGTVLERTASDNQNHDVSVPIDEGKAGLTIHCNSLVLPEAAHLLTRHCDLRKYAEKADRWFGLCLSPQGDIRLATGNLIPWKRIAEVEQQIGDFKVQAASRLISSDGKRGRPRVNERCPCGSGLKFKRCHGSPRTQ